MFENKTLKKLVVIAVTIIMIFIIYMSFKNYSSEKFDWTSTGMFVLAFITITPLLYKAFLDAKIIISPNRFKLKFTTSGNNLDLELGIVSKYQSSILKNIEVNIKNKSNSEERQFVWYVNYGYNVQILGNNSLDNFSYVYPIYNIKADESYPFHAGFVNDSEQVKIQNIYDKYETFYEEVKVEFNKLEKGQDTYGKLDELAKQHSKYSEILSKFEDVVFWEQAEYELKISIEFLDFTQVEEYRFNITNSEYKKLIGNACNLVMLPLRNLYFSNFNNSNFPPTSNIKLIKIS